MQIVNKHANNGNSNSPRGGQYNIGLFGLPDPTARCIQPPALPHPASAAALVSNRRHKRFQAFVRLAAREQRPVGKLIAEWLADCEALIGRDELFEDTGIAITPAMRGAAFASDERERNGRVDDEHADCLHRRGGTGYIEITLAMES